MKSVFFQYWYKKLMLFADFLSLERKADEKSVATSLRQKMQACVLVARGTYSTCV